MTLLLILRGSTSLLLAARAYASCRFGFPAAVVESSLVGRRCFENRIVDLSRGFDLASRRDEGQTPTKGPRSTSVFSCAACQPLCLCLFARFDPIAHLIFITGLYTPVFLNFHLPLLFLLF